MAPTIRVSLAARRLLWIVLSCSFLFSLWPLGSVKAQLPLRRFALVVGHNRGGPERESLRYATKDARAVSTVLEQLGGVLPQDALLLLNPTKGELTKSFTDLRERVRASGARTEVVFYFSGHSDEQGMLLGDNTVSFSELRRWLNQIATDLRIAILDSCASGAFTRLKGGITRVPFLFDRSTQVTGHAFLTSSSADEAAQESDRIGGSYFTHFLLSGLRGGADTNGDGKVTLTEAYRFAFDETLARTYKTQQGAQHPAYEIRLKGTGDLVLTDLRSTSAQIAFDASFEGRLFLRDEHNALIAELYKKKHRSVSLAVPPGKYTIELSIGSDRWTATVIAQSGRTTPVNKSLFRKQTRESTVARGTSRTYLVNPFAAAIIPPYGSNPRVRPYPIKNFVDLSLLYDNPDAVSGLQLSLGVSETKYAITGAQYATVYNRVARLTGAQLTIGLNWVSEFGSGSQMAWLINLCSEQFVGMQLAAVNLSQELSGAQLAGFNAIGRYAAGLQFGLVNWATQVDGVQAGVVNVSATTNGVMLGAVNVSSGYADAQIGLINYADEAEVSLGVIGITRKGGAHIELTTGDVAMMSMSLRLDANSNYTFAGVSYHPLGESEKSYLLGAGLGAKTRLFRSLLWLEYDLGYHFVQPLNEFYSSLPNSLVRLRLMARVAFHKYFSVLIGTSLNTLIQLDEERRVRPGFRFPSERLTHDDAEIQVRIWPGFVTGLLL